MTRRGWKKVNAIYFIYPYENSELYINRGQYDISEYDGGGIFDKDVFVSINNYNYVFHKEHRFKKCVTYRLLEQLIRKGTCYKVYDKQR